jgi:hypothetical protein
MLRVSGAFVTRWYAEWQASGDSMLCPPGYGERHARVERFLEVMKYDLAKVLLAAPADTSNSIVENSKESAKSA